MSKELIERLRGKVRVPITDGLGPAGGEEPDNADFFVRSFPASPLALEAAAALEAALSRAEAAEAEVDVLTARCWSAVSLLPGDMLVGALQEEAAKMQATIAKAARAEAAEARVKEMEGALRQ